MSVVTGEPRTRRPGIFGMIHYRQALDDISKRLTVISAPARRLSVCPFSAETALRICENAAVKRSEFGNNSKRKKRMLSLLDSDILTRRNRDVGIHPPKPVVLVVDGKCPLVLQRRRRVFAHPFAVIGKDRRLRICLAQFQFGGTNLSLV